MIITIDTSKDSKEDIKKVMKMLEEFVKTDVDSSNFSNPFMTEPKKEEPAEFVNMFANNSETKEPEKSVFNLFDNPEPAPINTTEETIKPEESNKTDNKEFKLEYF